MKLVRIKALCRRAHVEKLDAGAKGLTLAFRDNSFANPAGLVKWVTSQGSLARVRPDMRIVVVGDFEKLKDRLDGALTVMREIAKIAGKKGYGIRRRRERATLAATIESRPRDLQRCTSACT